MEVETAEIYDRIERWHNYLTWGAWRYDRSLLAPGRAFIVSSDGEKIIAIGDDNKGSLFEYDYDGRGVSIDLQYLQRAWRWGSPFACPSCGQLFIFLLDANQQVVDGVIPISKDTRFFHCACDYRFFFYDSLESLSLPFKLVELAPLYFYGMSQEADLFLRYVMSDDGNTLVEELGTLSYKPKGTSLTEIPSFRFLNWCGEGPSFVSESHAAFDVRLWRKRIYELDDDKFEEGSYHPYLDGWERVIRKVKKVPDEYAYRRMVEASAQVDANLLQAPLQAQKKKKVGRPIDPNKEENLQTYKEFAERTHKRQDIAEWLSGCAKNHLTSDWRPLLKTDIEFENLCKRYESRGHNRETIMTASDILFTYQNDTKLLTRNRTKWDRATSALGVAQVIASLEMEWRNEEGLPLDIDSLSYRYSKVASRWKMKDSTGS